MVKILIVDDDSELRAIIADIFKGEGFSPLEAADGRDAIRICKKEMPDAVLVDLKMPNMNGMDTMREVKKIDATIPVIILTAHGDIPTAVEAMKSGAYDFTLKPPEFERLIMTIKRAIEMRTLQNDFRRVNAVLESSIEHLLGKSSAVKRVIKQLEQVAQTDFSVIIQGETGTGKSVVAGAIQNMSKRADAPFIRVDIGLIPDRLVESELFGYKKGAFTGADKDKTGYFDAARGGTIFIDELENTPAQMQAKLLSVIDSGEIFPLGSSTPVSVDVRIIAATNKDIRESVKRGEFRSDLFYRFGEFIITLPPLRERIEDIPFFASRFLFEASAEMNKQIKEITSDAIDLLIRHDWPGNIRELKNVMRKATLITESDSIDGDCIASLLNEKCIGQKNIPFTSLKDTVRECEKRTITQVLAQTGGNKTKAAELLDISYTGLFAKLKEYDIRA